MPGSKLSAYTMGVVDEVKKLEKGGQLYLEGRIKFSSCNVQAKKYRAIGDQANVDHFMGYAQRGIKLMERGQAQAQNAAKTLMIGMKVLGDHLEAYDPAQKKNGKPMTPAEIGLRQKKKDDGLKAIASAEKTLRITLKIMEVAP
ncbi:MAG: hypothetical protein AAGB05_02735 [Pseudomonadota bacterium]